jgi:hypothetical protein
MTDFQRCHTDRQESTQNAVIPAIIWHMARVMTEVEKSRTTYHWGTPENRIYRNVAIPEPSRLEMILTWPLFGAHSMYRTRLQGTRVKGAVYLPDFQKLMQQFLDEWAGKYHASLCHFLCSSWQQIPICL